MVSPAISMPLPNSQDSPFEEAVYSPANSYLSATSCGSRSSRGLGSTRIVEEAPSVPAGHHADLQVLSLVASLSTDDETIQ